MRGCGQNVSCWSHRTCPKLTCMGKENSAKGWLNGREKLKTAKDPIERIQNLFQLLGVTIKVEGQPPISPILIVAPYKHTSHFDALAVTIALNKLGVKQCIPVSKGSYWQDTSTNHRHHRQLTKYFPRYYLTPTDEQRAENPGLSTVEILTEKVLAEEHDVAIIIFPEGSRNSPAGKIHSGLFALSANLVLHHGINAPVLPVVIVNMIPELRGGDIDLKSIIKLVWWRIRHNLLGKHIITIRFLDEIPANSSAVPYAVESSIELAAWMMLLYIKLLGDVYESNQLQDVSTVNSDQLVPSSTPDQV